jgi:hypothetical protein
MIYVAFGVTAVAAIASGAFTLASHMLHEEILGTRSSLDTSCNPSRLESVRPDAP